MHRSSHTGVSRPPVLMNGGSSSSLRPPSEMVLNISFLYGEGGHGLIVRSESESLGKYGLLREPCSGNPL